MCRQALFTIPKMPNLNDSRRSIMAGGYSGRIGFMDLSSGEIREEKLDPALARDDIPFLIHNILARRGYAPEGVMVPISASMLKNPADYDASLESFSRQIMPLVEYSLNEEGRMIVHNDTAGWYRYIDMTPQAEALFRFIDQTIDTELAGELAFLASYDETKRAIQEIVDMPDRQIDLFIRFCLQNNGRLSARKRASHFDSLS